MGRNWFRDDPVADAEDWAEHEPKISGYCESCKKAIYKGESYYDIEGELLCDDFGCTDSWLRRFKKYGK